MADASTQASGRSVILRYVGKRLAQAVLVLWAAWTLSFVLLQALPGNAILNRIKAPDSGLTPADGKVLLAYYGLDKPIWLQYLDSLGNLLRGDLGFSLSTGSTVTKLLGDALPNSLELTGLGFLVAVVVAGSLALLSSYSRFRWLRDLLRLTPALFAAVPTFVIGILLLQYFSFELHVIPAVDNGTFSGVVAPAITLGISASAPLAQVLTTSIRNTRKEPFVLVAQAKGAGEARVFRLDVLRNSVLPLLTLLGLTLGELIAGSIVTETVFARPGIGQLTVSSVESQDLPVVQGVVLVAATIYVLVNLVVDLAYPLVDPRILLETARPRRVRRSAATAVAVPTAGAAAVPAAAAAHVPTTIATTGSETP